jgi:hypothetical protein
VDPGSTLAQLDGEPEHAVRVGDFSRTVLEQGFTLPQKTLGDLQRFHLHVGSVSLPSVPLFCVLLHHVVTHETAGGRRGYQTPFQSSPLLLLAPARISWRCVLGSHSPAHRPPLRDLLIHGGTTAHAGAGSGSAWRVVVGVVNAPSRGVARVALGKENQPHLLLARFKVNAGAVRARDLGRSLAQSR